MGGRKLRNPVIEGLDRLCDGNDAAIGRVFGVTRQSIGQWRRHSSIPRHFMRAFSEITGVTVDDLLEYSELMNGVNYGQFLNAAKRNLAEERRCL